MVESPITFLPVDKGAPVALGDLVVAKRDRDTKQCSAAMSRKIRQAGPRDHRSGPTQSQLSHAPNRFRQLVLHSRFIV
jgi:hypothetical protein